MKIFVDRKSCIGCGMCVRRAENLFHLDDEGISVAIEGVVPKEEEDMARDMKMSCPMSAIIVEE